MMVRPSINNLHEFVAEENTCFFDICLPNYTADSLRRITYYKEITTDVLGQAATADLGGAAASVLESTHKSVRADPKEILAAIDPTTVADSTLQLSSKIDGLTLL